jgi:hypothetical protein
MPIAQDMAKASRNYAQRTPVLVGEEEVVVMM